MVKSSALDFKCWGAVGMGIGKFLR